MRHGIVTQFKYVQLKFIGHRLCKHLTSRVASPQFCWAFNGGNKRTEVGNDANVSCHLTVCLLAFQLGKRPIRCFKRVVFVISIKCHAVVNMSTALFKRKEVLFILV